MKNNIIVDNSAVLSPNTEFGKRYNWALLGCGTIAVKMAEDLKRLPNANLYAVASRDKSKADDYSERFGFEKAYGNYEEMLADPNIDIVYISTPHTYHHQHTLMALKAKKAVLCEKPFAMNSAQVAEMIACARENNVFLMEAFWTRFLPNYNTALEIINSAQLGELKMLNANFAFTADFIPEGRFFNPALGGGSLLDVGVYTLFFSLITLGKPLEIKTIANFGSTGVEESILISFRYADNRLASLMSSITTHATSHTEYCFSKGYLRINKGAYSPTTVSIWKEGDAAEQMVQVPSFDGHGYLFEAHHVMQCLDAGMKESDILPLSFSTDLIEIMDAVRKNAGIEFNVKQIVL